MKLGPDVDLRSIAARTPGFAGADLANVVNEAALLAARRDHAAVLRSDFEEAIERVVAGLEKKNRRISEKEKEIVEGEGDCRRRRRKREGEGDGEGV